MMVGADETKIMPSWPELNVVQFYRVLHVDCVISQQIVLDVG